MTLSFLIQTHSKGCSGFRRRPDIGQFSLFKQTLQDISSLESLLLHGVEHVGETALAAILAIEMGRHENSGSALLAGALASQAVDLAVVVDSVVLQHGQLDLLMLVLDLLGGRVVLLLALLAATTEAEDKMEGRLCNQMKN